MATPKRNGACMSKHNTNLSLTNSERKWLSDEAKRLKLKGGRSELVGMMIKKLDGEHDFIKECALTEGLTPLQAEIKHKEYWGL